MNENQFWTLIEHSRQVSQGDIDEQTEIIRTALTELGCDTIVEFENHLNSYISALSRFDVLAANFMIQSYVSDDGFEDFRAWLILNGKTRFEAALKNIESIAEWLERDDVDNIDGSRFVTIAVQAYEDAGGNSDEFYKQIAFAKEVDFEQTWPDNKQGFESKWPLLCKKFWNQARIEEMHAE